MPYKDPEHRRIWGVGYYAGWRIATIFHLGGKCVNVLEDGSICGEDDIYKLTIGHDPPLNRRASSEQDLKDLSVMKVLCYKCHKEGDWGRHGHQDYNQPLELEVSLT